MTATISNTEYKKALKKIREIEQLKQKSIVTDEEREKIGKEKYYRKIIKEKNKITMDDLPEEILYCIMSYLPFGARLSFLRKKYEDDFVIKKLENTNMNANKVKVIFTLSQMFDKFVNDISRTKSEIPNYLIWLKSYQEKVFEGTLSNVNKSPIKSLGYSELWWVKKLCTNILQYVIKHQTKIYTYNSHGTKKEKICIREYEEQIFSVYKTILILCK
jgi:hypothetical protein